MNWIMYYCFFPQVNSIINQLQTTCIFWNSCSIKRTENIAYLLKQQFYYKMPSFTNICDQHEKENFAYLGLI